MFSESVSRFESTQALKRTASMRSNPLGLSKIPRGRIRFFLPSVNYGSDIFSNSDDLCLQSPS